METVRMGIAARKLSTTPKYADGGVVHPFTVRGVMNRVKEMLTPEPETMTQKFARQDAERAAKTQPAVTPPAEPTEKPNVIDKINARNKLLQGLKDGGTVKAGIIRGPGTGTSDSIKGKMPVGSFVMPKDSTDVMVSNGETHFTPEMAQKVGTAALMMAKNLTHTPVAEQGEDPAKELSETSEENETYLKNGGAVSKMRGVSKKYQHFSKGGIVQGDETDAFMQPQENANKTPYFEQLGNIASAIVGKGNAGNYDPNFAAQATPAQTAIPPAVPSYGVSAGAPQAGAGRGFVNPALANPSTPTPASPLTKIDLGNGITKTTGGSSPLFSNVGDADNAALMGRGKVSAQNQLAMNGIQARQDIADAATQQRLKYESEVDNARKFREGVFQGGVERRALNGNRNALALLQGQVNDATARRGQDIQAAAQTATSQNAAARLGIDRTTAGLQNQQTTQQINAAKQMQDLQTRLLTAKPEERAAIEDNLRALQGKYEKPVADRFTVVPGGTDEMGNRQASRVLNNQTGQFVDAAPQQKTAFETGKVYTDAKGNRATWNGTAFVPAK